jgi:alpha-ribazole phosphatase
LDGNLVVLLCRHGLTDENQKGKYIGWSNPPLSPSGIQSLKKDGIQYPSYDLVYSSDLIRCKQTVQLLFPRTPLITTPKIREIHFGDWEGMHYEQLKCDDQYQQWIQNMERPIPNGESLPIFRQRVDCAWKQIIEDLIKYNVNRVAIVTHGGVIRQLLTTFVAGNMQRGFWDWSVPHGHGYELCWSNIDLEGGLKPCTSFRAVPLMENENGSTLIY